MSDQEEPTSDKKSNTKLKVLSGQAQGDAPKKAKDKYRSIHAKVVDAMLGNHGRLMPFPAILHRWVDHEGNSQIYEQSNRGTVRFRADDHIHALIASYWDKACGDLPSSEFWGHVTADDLSKIRKLWLAKAPARHQKWLPLAWASSTKLALHKMPYDPLPLTYSQLEASCPRFHEFMDRTTNHKTLMAWIGSLFDETSQRQQYAWIYGGGGNGKSALVNAIMSALGPVASSEQPPTRDAKHWTIGLKNKRLVVFADCNNTSFITSGDFKTLTGEDAIRMEPKGKPSYSEHIHAKFLVLSNDRPRVSSTKADLRRVLFFSVGDIKHDFGTDYESRLAEEVPAFLSICWAVYQEVTAGNPRMVLKAGSKEEINSVVADAEQEMAAFVDGNLVPEVLSTTDSKKNQNYVRAETMKQLMIKSGFRDEYDRKKLRDYLERTHGIVRKKIKIKLKGSTTPQSRLAYINCRDLTDVHDEATEVED